MFRRRQILPGLTQASGVFPSAVAQPVQYDSRIRALSVLLNTDYKLPFEKIEQLLGYLYDCTFNESTALSANRTCYEKLEAVGTTIKSSIEDSESANFDETGMRVACKLHWLHTASARLFTYLFVHTHRGREALESEASLVKDYQGWAVHDCWENFLASPTVRMRCAMPTYCANWRRSNNMTPNGLPKCTASCSNCTG